jgi:8-oxo-dGTP pyrophosphatase MutT (NUDIX family)
MKEANSSNLSGRLREQLSCHQPQLLNRDDYFPAAVVLPLVQTAGRWGILFEIRSSQLAWQPGEICFPGGRIETDDLSPERAAVRETCEELGIPASSLEIVGALDYLISSIGVLVHPFVGIISAPENIKPNSDEVEQVFIIPLEYFLTHEPQGAQMEVATRPLPGFPLEKLPGYPAGWRRRATYPVLFYHYENYVLWGLTARIVKHFVSICPSSI